MVFEAQAVHLVECLIRLAIDYRGDNFLECPLW